MNFSQEERERHAPVEGHRLTLTVVGWTDRGRGFQASPEAATRVPDPELWSAAERLRQSGIRQPPDRIRNTQGVPLWSLVSVETPRMEYWCLAVQYRAPGQSAGTVQFAFCPVDSSAGDVWAAAASLLEHGEVLPWGRCEVDVAEAHRRLATRVCGEAMTHSAVRDRVRTGLAQLAAGRRRLLVPGEPTVVVLALGKLLALLPDVTVQNYLWTTCLLHAPESQRDAVVSGAWPERFVRAEKVLASRVAEAFAERTDPRAEHEIEQEYGPTLDLLAGEVTAGPWVATEDERGDPGGAPGLLQEARHQAEQNEAPTTVSSHRGRVARLREAVASRVGGGEDPWTHSRWLFGATVAKSADSGDQEERRAFHTVLDAAMKDPGLLPVPRTRVEAAEPAAWRLAGLLRAHCEPKYVTDLLLGPASPYYPAGEGAEAVAVFLREAGVSAPSDQTPPASTPPPAGMEPPFDAPPTQVLSPPLTPADLPPLDGPGDTDPPTPERPADDPPHGGSATAGSRTPDPAHANPAHAGPASGARATANTVDTEPVATHFGSIVADLADEVKGRQRESRPGSIPQTLVADLRDHREPAERVVWEVVRRLDTELRPAGAVLLLEALAKVCAPPEKDRPNEKKRDRWTDTQHEWVKRQRHWEHLQCQFAMAWVARWAEYPGDRWLIEFMAGLGEVNVRKAPIDRALVFAAGLEQLAAGRGLFGERRGRLIDLLAKHHSPRAQEILIPVRHPQDGGAATGWSSSAAPGGPATDHGGRAGDHRGAAQAPPEATAPATAGSAAPASHRRGKEDGGSWWGKAGGFLIKHRPAGRLLLASGVFVAGAVVITVLVVVSGRGGGEAGPPPEPDGGESALEASKGAPRVPGRSVSAGEFRATVAIDGSTPGVVGVSGAVYSPRTPTETATVLVVAQTPLTQGGEEVWREELPANLALPAVPAAGPHGFNAARPLKAGSYRVWVYVLTDGGHSLLEYRDTVTVRTPARVWPELKVSLTKQVPGGNDVELTGYARGAVPNPPTVVVSLGAPITGSTRKPDESGFTNPGGNNPTFQVVLRNVPEGKHVAWIYLREGDRVDFWGVHEFTVKR